MSTHSIGTDVASESSTGLSPPEPPHPSSSGTSARRASGIRPTNCPEIRGPAELLDVAAPCSRAVGDRSRKTYSCTSGSSGISYSHSTGFVHAQASCAEYRAHSLPSQLASERHASSSARQKVPVAPKQGATLLFEGQPDSYTPNPFMMTMSDGTLLTKSAPPAAKKPAAGRTTPHKKPAQ